MSIPQSLTAWCFVIVLFSIGPASQIGRADDTLDRPVRTIDADDGRLRWVAFSPDGTSVAACGDRFVQLFDPDSGRQIRRFTGHTGHIDRFTFSPDGSLLASAGSDHTVHVWETDTADLITVLRDHTDHVIGVQFSADGRWLASTAAFNDGTIRIWDCNSWTEQCRAQSPQRTNAMYVAFSPDGRSLVSSGYRGGVRVYDFDGSRLELQYERHHDDGEMVPHVVCAADGQSFLTSSWDRTLRSWELSTGDLRWSAAAPDYARCFEASVFAPGGQTIYCVTRDETIQARDAATGALQSSFRWQDEVRGLALSPDGRLLATAGHRGKIKIWQTARLNSAE